MSTKIRILKDEAGAPEGTIATLLLVRSETFNAIKYQTDEGRIWWASSAKPGEYWEYVTPEKSYGEPTVFDRPASIPPRPTFVFEDVTRITVVGKDGIGFERYNYFDGVELHLQDDGRTLKIFPRREETE